MWSLWLDFKVWALPHLWAFKTVELFVLAATAFFFYQTVRSGRATAEALYPQKLIDVLYEKHRWYRIALDAGMVLAVCLIEFILQVKGLRSDSPWRQVHLWCVGAFLASFCLAHVFHGKSERFGFMHRYFGYLSAGFFMPVTILGLYLYWQL